MSGNESPGPKGRQINLCDGNKREALDEPPLTPPFPTLWECLAQTYADTTQLTLPKHQSPSPFEQMEIEEFSDLCEVPLTEALHI